MTPRVWLILLIILRPNCSPHYSDVLAHFRGLNLGHFLCCLAWFPTRCPESLFALRICWLINSCEIFWTALEKFHRGCHSSIPLRLFLFLFDFAHCVRCSFVLAAALFGFGSFYAQSFVGFELCKLFACCISTGVPNLVYSPFTFSLIAVWEPYGCVCVFAEKIDEPVSFLWIRFLFKLLLAG